MSFNRPKHASAYGGLTIDGARYARQMAKRLTTDYAKTAQGQNRAPPSGRQLQ